MSRSEMYSFAGSVAAAFWLLGVGVAQNAATVTLSGRVVDMRGEGLPAAEVWATREPDGQAWRTRTDGEGLYRLAVPRDVQWRLFARADGHCCVAHYQWEPFPPQLIVVHEAATLRGVLTNKRGDPVARAAVFAEPKSSTMETVANAMTDDRGAFAIRGVALGANRVVAWIEGEGLAIAEVRVTCDAEVRLMPCIGATTSLKVTLRDVPDVDRPRVTLTLTGNYSGGSFGGRPERPAPFFVHSVPADGWHVEHLPDWEWIVAPYAKGVRFRPSVVTVASGKGPHAIEFVAKWPTPAPTTVRAIVRDGEQHPVPGLRIGFYGSSFSARIDAATDAGGKVTIESPWAIEQPTFVALDDRWQSLRAQAATGKAQAVTAGTQPEEIELEAIAGCSVSGRVLTADGRPAAIARVQLERLEDGRRAYRVAETSTDADGSFALCQLAADEQLRLVVNGANGLLRRDAISTGKAGTATPLGDLRLERAAIVEGVVHSLDGSLSVGAVVQMSDRNLASIAGLQRSVVVTDSRGRFRFVGVPAGTARLLVRPDGESALVPEPPFEVEPGQTHTFELVDRTR